MKEIFKQLNVIWQERNRSQKIASLMILVLVIATLGYILFGSQSTKYVPLYPGKNLSSAETTQLASYLERFSVPFQISSENGLLVGSEHLEKVQQSLAESGFIKQEGGKGFELFDTNTWIKGEKELQVLEMRALKGQLEKDLSAFEHIKSASVILDIPPPKTFNGAKYPTKASVILSLMPGAHLSASELRAITNHLAGAVRGLEPHMIAISDTRGKLYKALDFQGVEDPYNDAGICFEEHVEEKVSELLSHLVGDGHFTTSVQALLEKGTEAVRSLSIAVVIDQSTIPQSLAFQKEIERQLAAIARGYGLAIEPTIDFIPFNLKVAHVEKQEGRSLLGLLATFFFIGIALVSLLPFLKKFKQKRNDDLFNVMTRIDVKKLTHSMQNEDPQTIALMLSYLEPKKAEQMIAALNAPLQEQVLYHLAEMEKEET